MIGLYWPLVIDIGAAWTFVLAWIWRQKDQDFSDLIAVTAGLAIFAVTSFVAMSLMADPVLVDIRTGLQIYPHKQVYDTQSKQMKWEY